MEIQWQRCFDLLEKSLEYAGGRWNMGDILHELMEGRMQLFVAFDDERIYGAVVTQVMSYPRMRVLNIAFCGGEFIERWIDPMLDMIRLLAYENDCVKWEVSCGRKGWRDLLGNRGFSQNSMWYEGDL